MNRSIDSRSDLYSLGVTLYEMLVGALPFAAADPMEWVHCHIARQALSPSERVPDIPEPVSAIVMKLLSKTAEDRYQTAAGVEADLRRCLAEWKCAVASIPFLSARTTCLTSCSSRKSSTGGKVKSNCCSRLSIAWSPRGRRNSCWCPAIPVSESRRWSTNCTRRWSRRGLFASGKFDQYKRDIPYATLAQAFQHLARQILGQSETELDHWRAAIHEALGPNGQLMVNLIPELELIIGDQPPVAELSPQDAQNRFQMVFRRLLAVFARPEHPLALFLDDLQWLDAATLHSSSIWSPMTRCGISFSSAPSGTTKWPLSPVDAHAGRTPPRLERQSGRSHWQTSAWRT